MEVKESVRHQTIMSELAKVLGPGKHVVGVPGGNQNAANIQNRIRGAQDEAQKYPDIEIKGPFYSKETPQDAAAKMEEVQTANPGIDGWAMIGSWALFTDALLKWEPGKVKIVSVDALPAQLPYIEKGVVQMLLAQKCYDWGAESVKLMYAEELCFAPKYERVRKLVNEGAVGKIFAFLAPGSSWTCLRARQISCTAIICTVDISICEPCRG